VRDVRHLVVGTWIQGLLLVKVGPADGAMRGIVGLPDLGGRPAAVFCTFDVNPFDSLNRMAARLQSRGARILPIAGRFPRRKKLARVPDFVDRLLEAMRAPVGEPERAR
jgi:hypothetical protein